MTDVPEHPEHVNPKDYFQRYQVSSRKSPLGNLRNATLATAQDEAFEGRLWFNEMTRDHEIIDPAPRSITQGDIRNHTVILQEECGLPTVGIETAHHAMLTVCEQNRYHPVKAYLENLEWDENERLTTWLHHYLGAEDGPYNCEIGEDFLISAVARIYLPGCKVDYMMVLEGGQGIGKSQACRVIFGDHFSDSLPDISNKDASLHVSRYWGIEVAEMHKFNRADTLELKSFVTRQVEQFRTPYNRVEETFPRQCVFIGTTNEALYLKDPTGGRRFWPVKCTDIDLEQLECDRDQLFAEAVHKFKRQKAWWPNPAFEELWIKPEQEARRSPDVWEDLVLEYIEVLHLTEVRVIDICQAHLGIPKDKISKADQGRIADILRQLGWKHGRDARGRRCWKKPT